MRRIIAALLLSASSALALAQDAKPIELQPDAPARHVVVRGDTLWGIAGKFLKNPYRWPELWHLNKDQIRNPQLIYPGQVVVLDRSGTTPQLKLEGEPTVKLEPKVYSAPIPRQIPAIPQNEIEPFLTQPLVIEQGGMDHAPRIVATQEDRVYVGTGNEFYAVGVKGDDQLWNVYRPGRALKDPGSGESLGVEAVFLGTARKVHDGATATFVVESSKQEIGPGDRLTPVSKADIISYAPHAPDQPVNGRVLAVYGGEDEGGTYSIVALSGGKREGIEVGHVLAVYRSDVKVTDHFTRETYQLPDERYGLVFVFRVFDRVSYALVMNVTRPLIVGDAVHAP